MYLKHFSLKEKPFSISPDPRFLFMSNRYREALTHLTFGVKEGGGFVLLTGEVGTGKTTVCRCLLQQLPENTRLAFVLNPKLNSVELLATICDELKIDYPQDCQSLKILTDRLSDYLLNCYQQNLNVVVMIDEAQNLENEVLEQIRLLTNLETNQRKLLQIILVGQPELQEKLAHRSLRQLAQRVTARYHLKPLTRKETVAYILHRVRIAGCNRVLFSRPSIELLHRKTQGVPRLINTICDRALIAAASRNKAGVDQKIMLEAVREVLGEFYLEKSRRQKDSRRLQLASLKWVAAGVMIALIASGAYWLGQQKADAKVAAIQSKVQPESRLQAEPPSSVVTPQDLLQNWIGDQRWDTNGTWSMGNLLALWQIDYSPLEHGDACEFAASYGLRCARFNGYWQQLREFNRPAMLRFSAGLQGDFWATLETLDGVNARMLFGENRVTIPMQQLALFWSGEYQLLWQAPPGFEKELKVGDQGQAVSWLSQTLNKLSDIQQPALSRFTPALAQQLKAFQMQKKINADGIAGMQTIVKLNNESFSGLPTLTSSQVN